MRRLQQRVMRVAEGHTAIEAGAGVSTQAELLTDSQLCHHLGTLGQSLRPRMELSREHGCLTHLQGTGGEDAREVGRVLPTGKADWRAPQQFPLPGVSGSCCLHRIISHLTRPELYVLWQWITKSIH